MNPAEYFKILLEFELVKAGVYDNEIHDLINKNENVKKKYYKDFNIIEKVPGGYHRNPQPDMKFIRIWWFKNYKNPELFRDD